MKNIFKNILVLFSLLFISTGGSMAQIPIPDPNFKLFLQNNFPSTIDGLGNLDTTIAKTITGNFVCNSSNISDFSGIEYFINIDNNLFATGNNLSVLPGKFGDLTKVIRLELDNNKLTSLPDISKLSGSLTKFTCTQNQLTSIPNFSNFPVLYEFRIDNNQINSLPTMTNLPQINTISCGGNNFTTLPDLSDLTNLQRFYCNGNKLTTLPDLTNLTLLRVLRFEHNNVTTFPNISGLTQLWQLYGKFNQLTFIPDLNAFPALTDVEMQNNNLTFEDIIPSSSHPNFSSFKFMPQAKVGNTATINVVENHTFTIDLNIDDAVGTNIYNWYKNSTLIATTSTNQFIINNVNFNDAGVYTCEITNSLPALSGMKLFSNPVTLNVIPCIITNNIKIVLPDTICSYPIKLKVDTTSFSGVAPPYNYTLKNNLTGENFSFNTFNLETKKEGVYDLVISDQNNCSTTVTGKINLYRNEFCDPVFYPDGDGIADTYFIEETGHAKIFNKRGELVKEFDTPGYWDGKNSRGEDAVTGVYLIKINGSISIRVNLLR